MNMNKNILLVIVIFVLMFLFPVKTYAANNNCSSLDEFSCKHSGNCQWGVSGCMGLNVAQDPCNEPDIRRVLNILGFILLIAKIAVPLLIVGFGIFDIFKSVVDKDEKSLYKQLKQLGVRLLAGVIVFFVPNIVYAVFSLSDSLGIIDTDQYKTCASCILEPTSSTKCTY